MVTLEVIMLSKLSFFVLVPLALSLPLSAVEKGPVFKLEAVQVREIQSGSSGVDMPPLMRGIYAFHSENFSPGKGYTLYTKRLGEEKTRLCDCVADKEGSLYYPQGEKLAPLSSLFQSLSGFAPGEPVEYILIAKQGSDIQAIKLFPNPLETTDSEGRKISLEMLSPDRSSYALYLSHFKPNEQFISISQSGSDIQTTQGRVSERGKLRGQIMCLVKQEKGRVASVTITPVNSGKPIQLFFDWGS